jgi:hypothetical protein
LVAGSIPAGPTSDHITNAGTLTTPSVTNVAEAAPILSNGSKNRAAAITTNAAAIPTLT